MNKAELFTIYGLTHLEYKLLVLLNDNVDRVVATKTIMHELWGRTSEYELSYLYVLISNLRKKIGFDRVITRPGYGYRLSEVLII